MDSPHRVPPDLFRALPLRVHAILSEVPLHDVTVVDLPGGGAGRTVRDLQALLRDRDNRPGEATRALFALRSWLGRIFRWDDPTRVVSEPSFRDRIPPDLMRRSVVPSGTAQGLFETLYEVDDELLVEARNATVHAFLSMALRPIEDGYRLYWAVYVRRVSPFTPVYMTLIEPFRRFIVYPSILRSLRRKWQARYPSVARSSFLQ